MVEHPRNGAGSKQVYEDDAYAALQGLRNGLLRDVITEIGRIASDRSPDEHGVIRITLKDVHRAFVTVAKRYIEKENETQGNKVTA